MWKGVCRCLLTKSKHLFNTKRFHWRIWMITRKNVQRTCPLL
ncbi:hypothetical protein [Oceanobacillus sp. Castelsardo]